MYSEEDLKVDDEEEDSHSASEGSGQSKHDNVNTGKNVHAVNNQQQYIPYEIVKDYYTNEDSQDEYDTYNE